MVGKPQGSAREVVKGDERVDFKSNTHSTNFSIVRPGKHLG